jgi:hypothetical protein
MKFDPGSVGYLAVCHDTDRIREQPGEPSVVLGAARLPGSNSYGVIIDENSTTVTPSPSRPAREDASNSASAVPHGGTCGRAAGADLSRFSNCVGGARGPAARSASFHPLAAPPGTGGLEIVGASRGPEFQREGILDVR